MRKTTAFKITKGEGKSPFKLVWLDVDGKEVRRTHHKRVDLAYARAAVWNKKIPVFNDTAAPFTPTSQP